MPEPAPSAPGADLGRRAGFRGGWRCAIQRLPASGLPPREPGRLRRAPVLHPPRPANKSIAVGIVGTHGYSTVSFKSSAGWDMGKLLAAIGIAMSLAYLAVIWWLTGNELYQLRNMSLNEVGDFLAGVFGPLAILWLVLGFFQQGIELRQGTAALRIQGDELKNSVEQQRKLAESSMAALELESQARQEQNLRHRQSLRPILHLLGVNLEFSNGRYIATCRLFNDGAQIYSLSLRLLKGGEGQHHFAVYRTLDQGQSVDFKCFWAIGDAEEDLAIEVHYVERDTVKGFCRFMTDSQSDIGSISFMRDDDFYT